MAAWLGHVSRFVAFLAAGGVNNSSGNFEVKKLFILITIMFGGVAGATPGGLDRAGCHHSKVVGYHCHGVKLSQIVHTYPKESAYERSRRLAVQCRGLANDGVCFGYSDQR